MIPKTIKIAGKPYTVSKTSGTGLLGECKSTPLTITYEVNQADDQLRDTILHECLHAMDYAVRIGLKEKQVHALSAMLILFFKENKKLANWLVDGT